MDFSISAAPDFNFSAFEKGKLLIDYGILSATRRKEKL